MTWTERPTLTIEISQRRDRHWAKFPADAINASRLLLEDVHTKITPRGRRSARLMALRTRFRFHAEMRAAARALDLHWTDLMLANLSYDMVVMSMGCSTAAIATAEGPVLARNMDWWPERPLAGATCLIRTEMRGRWRHSVAGWPGASGIVTGMSARGFAIALNAVSCDEPAAKWGYPMLLMLRRVLEDAHDFSHAVDLLRSKTLISAAMLTVVGTSNDQRVVIERSPRRAVLRYADGDAALVTTNHYQRFHAEFNPHGSALAETSCGRLDGLVGLLSEHDPGAAVSDEALLFALTDPAVAQSITVQHVIMRPRDGRMRVCVPRHLIEPEAETPDAS